MAYNPGVAATGATSPLWALCLGVLHAVLGGQSISGLVASVFLLGAVLHLALLGLSARLILVLTRSTEAATLGGIALALSPQLTAAAFSGMEVTLTALLVVGAMLAFSRERTLTSGVLLALAAATRPEAATVGLVVFLALLWEYRALDKAREGLRKLGELSAPSVLVGGAIIGWNLWASGRPLPATFYVKQEFDVLSLLPRLNEGGLSILGNLVPLGWGLTLPLLLGLLVRPTEGKSRCRSALPLAAALGLTAASLLTVRPIDPAAWYHIRYLLPALPLLVIALGCGAAALEGLKPGSARIGLGLLLGLAVLQGGLSLQAVSHSLHNDTRNINEVQRAMGTWLAEDQPTGAWIASTDAGAVRYFSDLPTIDLIGLNTAIPMKNSQWAQQRAVERIVLIPSWFQPQDLEQIALVHQAKTANYSVTSNPAMGTQVVLGCKGEPEERVWVELQSSTDVAVLCRVSP